MQPWTQNLHISWRPALSFFEHRYSIMRELEELELLLQFETCVAMDDVVRRSILLADLQEMKMLLGDVGNLRIDLIEADIIARLGKRSDRPDADPSDPMPDA